MDALLRHVVPPLGPARTPRWLLVVALLATSGLWGAPTAHGQADTTAAPPDSLQPRRPDTTRSDTTRSDTTAPRPAPRPRPSPAYGTPVVDSLPARTPLVGVEHVLAQRPASFLYDLGAVGWPHGWSPEGLAPHRSRLWLDGRPYTDPLLGRARFDLLPLALLEPMRVGADPGGTAVGVHAAWRDYGAVDRPVTELRFRRDSNGLQAIEVGHSQQRRLSIGGTPGVLKITLGYGGRASDGAYASSGLERERRLWGQLQYRRGDWGMAVSDFSSRHRVGTHGGVEPPGARFESIYVLPPAEDNVRTPGAQRQTLRNDLTVRAWGPLLPGAAGPTTLSATWTSNTFDFRPGGGGPFSTSDTTWTVKATGGHGTLRQSISVGPHALTLGARGSYWRLDRTNVPQIEGARWDAHLFGRDSVGLGPGTLVLNAGWHATRHQQYPSLTGRVTVPLGPVRTFASAALTGQQTSWVERDGFVGFVRPLPDAPSSRTDRLLKATVGGRTHLGPVDLAARGFAHQIRGAVDLFAAPGPTGALTDTAAVRQLAAPVRRVGAHLSVGWRRAADRGLYATGGVTALRTLNAGASRRRARLARTLPRLYGRGRLGARFVAFQDLRTDLYVQARGWSAMNSRWFHPPTGRLVVPPLDAPVPAAPGVRPGPSGTVDVHAEVTLRGATMFFTFENVQAGTSLQPGTFVVPVYPLPARQFRFGVYWPIFD